jgi:hypothetical protein
MTTLNITCNTFSPVYNNPSNKQITINLSVTSQCGGTTTLGIYEIATNTLISSPQLQPGPNTIDVDPHLYLAVYCKSADHGAGGGCIAEVEVV